MKNLLLQSLVLGFLSWVGSFSLVGDPIKVGAGGYNTSVPAGSVSPPGNILRTSKVRGPMPSNDWWSSLAWPGNSFATYPHPLAVKTEANGLRIHYPGPSILGNNRVVTGSLPGDLSDFVLGHSVITNFSRPLVDGFSDWFVNIRFATNQHALHLAFGHGSPFVYARYEGGQPRLTFPQPPKIWTPTPASSAIGVTIQGRHYGLFGPKDSTWSGLGSTVLSCDTKGQAHFSVAILPDASSSTFALFQRYAHTHVTGTKVTWNYEPSTAEVTTDFAFETTTYEGKERGTIFALYPHQWHHTETTLLPLSFLSVRGTMKLAEGQSFRTRSRFTGILPTLPDAGGCDSLSIAASLATDLARTTGDAKDSYWANKQLARLANLIPIAEIYQLPQAEELRRTVRAKVEHWLSAVETNAQPKTSGMFWYDANWGALIGSPSSYGSDKELNDHHFHYGYLVKAAAEIARHDPDWARTNRWGGMVDLVIRDFASPDRHDPMFPFLRNFDPYAGHTWASGHAQFGDGNNNESSSEAMNAWTALILWGELTGRSSVRDLGVWLYTTEMQAIQEYWFDLRDENHPINFKPSVMTMMWGGKGANETWFTADPQLVHGINWLPIHGGSLYLGHSRDYAEKNYRALVSEHQSDRWNNWPDLIWMYRALSDSGDAIRQFEAAPPTLKLEDGNSWTNARHWIYNIHQLGQPDPEISASTPLATVFRSGKNRTYVVYHHQDSARKVRFSDGQEVRVEKAGYTVKRIGQ